MANVDLDNGMTASVRPSATINPRRVPTICIPQRPSLRLTPVRPKFCKIDSGQLFRSLLLFLLCLGLSQLPRAEKLFSKSAFDAASSEKTL